MILSSLPVQAECEIHQHFTLSQIFSLIMIGYPSLNSGGKQRTFTPPADEECLLHEAQTLQRREREEEMWVKRHQIFSNKGALDLIDLINKHFEFFHMRLMEPHQERKTVHTNTERRPTTNKPPLELVLHYPWVFSSTKWFLVKAQSSPQPPSLKLEYLFFLMGTCNLEKKK